MSGHYQVWPSLPPLPARHPKFAYRQLLYESWPHVAEWVPGICLARGAADTEQQQQLVAALSTVEWIASLSIAALPVKPLATNFVAATRRTNFVAATRRLLIRAA